MTDERFEQLIADHGRHLTRFVMTLTARRRQAAEDVVQETLLRAWRHLDVVAADEETGRRWLFAVARRLVIDEARRRKSRPSEVPEYLAERLPNADDTAGSAVAGFALHQAFHGLNPMHRTVLTEVYLRHRTVEEVADDLRIPPGTVRSRIHYALRTLRLAVTP
ncbi:sigma-70 family RNA polymerase sigma factor [Actinoplanes sp. TRM 88003]|uniref:Sigma-70 family RNA polymerase sigma factor n=1 Tax=Paractinoplanes aksuensis TaxID=2939490 RepID=A0ABT1E333_9ACTN|nr:sigma-70 family RNA polymerase sigma factor [Actinoplanes aksuensis]MCO8277508.1 sigma-70 family RNA polymerase sigma factor [Actinoplanes aksuensis]